jgi:CRISPR/Cas system CSM-associated protein Csm5 (group 7 of RAMP superfamily)
MDNKPKDQKPKLDWSDYHKLTPNQKAALRAYKKVQEAKEEFRQGVENIKPKMSRADRLKTIAFKNVMERRNKNNERLK